ncbi:MAG: hypothetical protein QOD65_1984 [Gaiellales bacterium]|nr:hypothetical protein [Gaiellales bacterium]
MSITPDLARNSQMYRALERTAREWSSSRTNARCGSVALDFADVRIARELALLPLCRLHFRKSRDSDGPDARAQDWTP